MHIRPNPCLRSSQKSSLFAAAVIAAAVLAAGCGGHSSSGEEKVWCVAPGEKVTPALKREYPELYMPKSACDKVGG